MPRYPQQKQIKRVQSSFFFWLVKIPAGLCLFCLSLANEKQRKRKTIIEEQMNDWRTIQIIFVCSCHRLWIKEVFFKAEDKYGEVEEMSVYENLGDHLVSMHCV